MFASDYASANDCLRKISHCQISHLNLRLMTDCRHVVLDYQSDSQLGTADIISHNLQSVSLVTLVVKAADLIWNSGDEPRRTALYDLASSFRMAGAANVLLIVQVA